MNLVKYMAWDKKSKKIRVVSSIVFDTKSHLDMKCEIKLVNLWGQSFNPSEDDNPHILVQREPKDVVLMQYTGINDKHNNEIYDGHRVKRTSLILGGDEITGEVKMVDGCWFIDNGNDAVRLFTETCDNEIIGNIYNKK